MHFDSGFLFNMFQKAVMISLALYKTVHTGGVKGVERDEYKGWLVP